MPQEGTLYPINALNRRLTVEKPMKLRKIEDFEPKPDPEAKSVRQIRIRYSDIEEPNSDPFMRHWIILKNLRQIRLGSDYEGHLAKKYRYWCKLQYDHQKIQFYFGGSRSKVCFLS